MDRSIVAYLAALALCHAIPCVAQVDLGFPKQPERQVTLPGRGAFTGAKLYAPESAGPFPAAVISHSCGPLRQNIFEWAQRFLAAGYAVLVVDHLGPRGIKSNCPPSNNLSPTQYAQDDMAAMKYLRALPFVDGKRIVHFGISYGAMSGLRLASEKFRERYADKERFAAIVSLYPWCNEQGGPRYQEHQWNFYDDTTTPLLVLLGADDDDSNPRSCVDKARENASKGMPVEYKVFPGTTHGFDNSLIGDKPYVFQQGSQTITYRYNRQSVDEAWQLTLDFIARRVGSPGQQ